MRIPLEFPDETDAPAGWMPLEAVIVIKFMDEAGVVRLREASTETLSTWEAVGMLIWAVDSLRAELQQGTEESG